MTTKQHKLIAEEVINNEFFDTLVFYDDYSGRSMYGEKSFGVVGQFDKLMTFLQVYGITCYEAALEPIADFRMDSMGNDTVIYPMSPVRD
ncbi:hypothetical protein P10VF_154 [Rhizobium phage vB_RleM_P10VF]|uniref:Uncharacterized protein n=1 Tax=Rhizobium phage vB_RleM_P10VF TaxID=1527770 RepID=A0A076YKQ1_9CAUD|nr:hypothetical protein P10VF_154 [Rhizobium phage vB_RleM_P10VF]AIK68367.1 hypothetical protein P10VF_154 [Rhizobium phage vB_RleM_P10VF]